MLVVNTGNFLDSTGLGSRDRMPVLIVMLLVNFFGSAGLGSRERCLANGVIFVAATFVLETAGLGSLERVFNDFIVFGSAGLGSLEIRVRTVGLGSLDLARFWKKLLIVVVGCLR